LGKKGGPKGEKKKGGGENVQDYWASGENGGGVSLLWGNRGGMGGKTSGEGILITSGRRKEKGASDCKKAGDQKQERSSDVYRKPRLKGRPLRMTKKKVPGEKGFRDISRGGRPFRSK